MFGFLTACGDESAASDVAGSNPTIAAKSNQCLLKNFIFILFILLSVILL
jgi:hypothetical protein